MTTNMNTWLLIWRDDSVIKCTSCFSRGLGLDFQLLDIWNTSPRGSNNVLGSLRTYQPGEKEKIMKVKRPDIDKIKMKKNPLR